MQVRPYLALKACKRAYRPLKLKTRRPPEVNKTVELSAPQRILIEQLLVTTFCQRVAKIRNPPLGRVLLIVELDKQT